MLFHAIKLFSQHIHDFALICLIGHKIYTPLFFIDNDTQENTFHYAEQLLHVYFYNIRIQIFFYINGITFILFIYNLYLYL